MNIRGPPNETPTRCTEFPSFLYTVAQGNYPLSIEEDADPPILWQAAAVLAYSLYSPSFWFFLWEATPHVFLAQSCNHSLARFLWLLWLCSGKVEQLQPRSPTIVTV